jgi:hypothetical protein
MILLASLCYAVLTLFCLAVAGAVLWIIVTAIRPRKEMWR